MSKQCPQRLTATSWDIKLFEHLWELLAVVSKLCISICEFKQLIKFSIGLLQLPHVESSQVNLIACNKTCIYKYGIACQHVTMPRHHACAVTVSTGISDLGLIGAVARGTCQIISVKFFVIYDSVTACQTCPTAVKGVHGWR